MNMQQPDFVVKGAMLGDFNVGKSSLFQKYMTGQLEHNPTIGVDFNSTTHFIDNHTIRFHLWDTAGQERFRSIVKVYVRNVFLFFLVVDVSRRQSFEHIEDWLSFIITNNSEYTEDNTIIVLLVNKVDICKKKWMFRKEDVERYVQNNKAINAVYYVSSKNTAQGTPVDDMFSSTLDKVYVRLKQNRYRLKGVVDRRYLKENCTMSTPPGSPLSAHNISEQAMSTDIMTSFGFKNESSFTNTCPHTRRSQQMCLC